MSQRSASGPPGRLGVLSNEIKVLRERLREGGGSARIDAHHGRGKLTARERIALLFDRGSPTFEIGLLVAHDLDEGGVPAAGVVTLVGRVQGREVVVVASDATVAGGAWRPETVAKILRAQEVAMRCRIPVLYLVDAEGEEGTAGGEASAGRLGSGRVLYHAAVMRRHLGVPQFAAVMGSCTGTAAYLASLSDVIVMVELGAFLGLGGPELVRQATGRDVSMEQLGGARAHTEGSGVAHYRVDDDPACIERLRALVGELPPATHGRTPRVPTPPLRLSYELYDLVPDDHRQAYDVHAVLECVLDGDALEEFQAGHAPELVCGTGYVEGVHVGVIANARGSFRKARDEMPRLGGFVYPESARKAAYFIETMDRQRTPLVFLQDVAGFMVGPEAERAGIIRWGADFIEAMAAATVPKIVLTLNHASGTGYHAMGGRGFDPDFTIALPTGRFGGGDTEGQAEGASGRADGGYREGGDAGYLDARRAAALGLVDEVLLPEELRPALGLLLSASLRNAGPHVGPFQLGPA